MTTAATHHGCTPTPYQSGESAREQGITKSGNRHVRWMTTELAWSWRRFPPDSALSCWFRQRFGSGGKRLRRIGMVAVARKFLIALWRFLETGVVPEGAVLKEGYKQNPSSVRQKSHEAKQPCSRCDGPRSRTFSPHILGELLQRFGEAVSRLGLRAGGGDPRKFRACVARRRRGGVVSSGPSNRRRKTQSVWGDGRLNPHG